MMLYPPVPQMLKSVPSRYLLVNVIARRARQVAIEEEEFKIPMDKMAVSEAIDEIAEGKIVAAVKNICAKQLRADETRHASRRVLTDRGAAGGICIA